MPKVSEAHKEQRRAQILEAAQRAFARHGYEGTTVAVLEEVTGLSRGAIFNYFPNKQATFQELVAKAEAELHEHKQERLDRFAAHGVRDDVPLETAAVFLSLVANGLALRRTLGDPMPDLDALAELVERGVAPRRSRKKTAERKTPTPRTRPTPRSRRPSSAG